MTRREAIRTVSLIMGGTIIGADLFIGCQSKDDTLSDVNSQGELDFLNEIAETILPTTSTPGGKAANVGAFMIMMLKDCYSAEDQEIFHKGIDEIEKKSKRNFDKPFMTLQPEQKHKLLVSLDKEQKTYSEKQKPQDPNHYFRLMKELTLLGYFTSEAGSTKALRYVAVPGKFIGTIPYKKGDKAWAIG